MTTKEQMLQAIRELPDDATVEDAMECLYLLYGRAVRVRSHQRSGESGKNRASFCWLSPAPG